jgi:hypothetical protein
VPTGGALTLRRRPTSGLLPCFGTCAHVSTGLEASRPFSPPYPLSLSFLVSLRSASAQGLPPTDAWCGWAHLSSRVPTPNLTSTDAQLHLARSHATAMENLISLVNKVLWASTTTMGRRARHARPPRSSPPMMLHCLWCPFLHWFPLPCHSAPCSHFCPVDLLRAPTATATRGSALVASNLQVPQVPTTRSHLVLRVIFMWTYRWNRSLQWGDIGLGFPYCSTCELLQIMVSVLGCDAVVYHCCRGLGPWCDHGDFHEAWEPLKRAEGESLRFSSYVVKVMPAVVLRWYLLQAGFVRHLWYR